MQATLTSFAALTICLLLLVCGAFAVSIPVTNASFETLPSGGLNVSCGVICAYSDGIGIPGWNTTGFYTGQFIPGGFAGNPPAYDGNYLAYTDTTSGTGGGIISQDVMTSAVAGETYTLQVEILHRTDSSSLAGVAQLTLNGVVVATATGIDGGRGTWSNWTALFTATPGQAGEELGILLSSNGTGQGDFDFVRLDQSSAVPEPGTLALLFGSGMLGLPAALRRKLK